MLSEKSFLQAKIIRNAKTTRVTANAAASNKMTAVNAAFLLNDSEHDYFHDVHFYGNSAADVASHENIYEYEPYVVYTGASPRIDTQFRTHNNAQNMDNAQSNNNNGSTNNNAGRTQQKLHLKASSSLNSASCEQLHLSTNSTETETIEITTTTTKPSQLPLPAYRRQFLRRNGVINSSNRPVEVDTDDASLLPSSPASSYDVMAADLLMRRSFNSHRSFNNTQMRPAGPSSSTESIKTRSPNATTHTPPMICALATASSTLHLATPQRSLRRCKSASPAPVRPPLLTGDQQNLIRKSWQKVSKTSIGRSIYRYMTAKCKDTGSLFREDPAGLGRHERYAVDLIQSAVDNLDDVDVALREWLETIGYGHRGFYVTSKHWDAFGEALTCVLTNWVGPGKTHRETVRAWRMLFSYMADRLGVSSRRCAPCGDSCTTSTPSAAVSAGGASACCIPRIQLLTLVANGPATSP